jgi:hypothetical protein
MSKLGFPIQKAVSMMRKFVFDQNYRDQLFYVRETESTSPETAKNIEDVLTDNFRRTKFKAGAFNRLKLDCAEYGSAVCYSSPGVLLDPHFKTVASRDSMGNFLGYERKKIVEPDIVINNKSVDPLLYFQDPDCPIPEESNYQGHIERWDINDFVYYVEMNKQHLITKNVQKILNTIKKSGYTDEFYKKDDDNQLTKYPVDVTIHYSTANIPGNEDNVIPYYFLMVGGEIIRIENNLFDENLIPYSILKFIPRNDVWWGNCDSEFVLPHENAINTLVGLKVDNAIRAEDQVTLFPKGAIDPSDWNNRHASGGMVGVEVPDGMNLQNMIYKYQFTDEAVTTFDPTMREINSNMQNIGSRPNVNQRQSRTGPLANTTATAVQSMEDISDIKESGYMEQFNYGMIRIARVNITLSQQFYPEDFSVVSSPGKGERLLDKDEILGAADISVRTALTSNKAFLAQKYINDINTIMNWRGTQDPEMMKIRLAPLVKNALHRLDLGDVNELYDDSQPMQPQIPQAVPSA